MAVFNIEGYNSYSGCDITVTASLPIINGETIGKYYTLGSIQTLSISTHQDKRPVRSLGVINAKDYVMGPRTIAGSMVFAVFNKHFATEIMNDLGAASGEGVVLPDEIPALDITINFANEYGRMSRMAIYGVKLINEGQVMSINDLYTENTYQFVALGLEPLSAEDSKDNAAWDNENKSKSFRYTQGPVITPSENSADTKSKEFLENSGANLSSQIKNNKELTPEDLKNEEIKNSLDVAIELSVVTTDAITEYDLGLATFFLNPTQLSGCINIYKGYRKKTEPDYTLAVVKNSSHNMSLLVGDYCAQYVDDSVSNFSNILNFSINVKQKKDSTIYDNIYPIIEKVTHDSIVVSNNSGNPFTTLNVFETGGVMRSYDIGRSSLTVDNLKEDSEYNLYFSNHLADRSDIVTVKTFEYENQEIDLLNNFINANNSLHINKNTMQLLSDKNMKNYNTLIDTVLTLPDSVEKEELLIYANQLTNNLIDSYNVSNLNHIKNNIQVHPFSNVISVDDYDKVAVYANNNNKKVLSKILNAPDKEFYGTPNKHYSIQGIDGNNNKTVKKDFVILKNNYLDELELYTDTEKYKEINLDYYNDRLKKYDGETIQSIAISDNLHCDLDLLEPPYIYQDENNRLYADINYFNLDKNKNYYLVYSEIHDALDFKPHRKIPFTLDTKTLNLDRYYLGLIKTCRYLFWIENDMFMKISKPFIFDYKLFVYDESEIDDIYKSELRTDINKMRAEFSNNYEDTESIKDLFNYIYDTIPQKKNVDNTAAMELIKYYTDSNYARKTLPALFELLKINNRKNKINVKFDITIDKKNKYIRVRPTDGFYICAIRYTADEMERLSDIDNTIFYGGEGYVMIYLTSDSMIYKSGFILIDCSTDKYMYSDELSDFVKEGDV